MNSLYTKIMMMVAAYVMLFAGITILVIAMAVNEIDGPTLDLFVNIVALAGFVSLVAPAVSAVSVKRLRDADLEDTVNFLHQRSLNTWFRFLPVVAAAFALPFMLAVMQGPGEKFYWAIGSAFVIANCLMWLAPHHIDHI